ncbi:MAG: hypothetical protein R2795_06165 [Saprospiraceae bacterium]
MKKSFDEQEAKVIFAISKLPLHFDKETLAQTYLDTFSPGLSAEQLTASLEVLTHYGVLRQTGKETYERKERIKNLVR